MNFTKQKSTSKAVKRDSSHAKIFPIKRRPPRPTLSKNFRKSGSRIAKRGIPTPYMTAKTHQGIDPAGDCM
jgi:hypothetical protein